MTRSYNDFLQPPPPPPPSMQSGGASSGDFGPTGLPPFTASPTHPAIGYQAPLPPDRSASTIIAWTVITLCTVVLFSGNFQHAREQQASQSAAPRVSAVFQIAGRYFLGNHLMTANLHPGGDTTYRLDTTSEQAIAAQATSGIERLATVALIGETESRDAALQRLNQLIPTTPPALADRARALPPPQARTLPAQTSATQPASSRFATPDANPSPSAAPPNAPPAIASSRAAAQTAPATASTAPASQPTTTAGAIIPATPIEQTPDALAIATALRQVYTRGPQTLSSTQTELLRQHLGWFGDLALSFGLPDANPDRTQVLDAARRTHATALAAALFGFITLAAGFVLFIILVIRLTEGRTRRRYQPAQADAGKFLEAFAVYLGGLVGAGLLVSALPTLISGLAPRVALMLAPTLVAIAWPLLRGVRTGPWKSGIGWTTGEGFFKEIAMGVVGYIALLPVLALGMSSIFFLGRFGTAHHPIEQTIGTSVGNSLLVLLLASVYAPITEETLFRGAFFHSLRRRHGWLVASLIVSFFFAAIHPQGWIAIPALMTVAMILAAIREWRGTIIASAAAHCTHNTILVLLMLATLR